MSPQDVSGIPQRNIVRRDDLSSYLDQTLEPRKMVDYCPNGLQVEGRDSISKMIAGVTASLDLINYAIEKQADAILVHHGWFWKGEERALVGYRKRRMQRLLSHDINLFAFHLPLDSHPELGNNAQWGLKMGWRREFNFGESGLGWGGTCVPTHLVTLAQDLGQRLGRIPLVIGHDLKPITRVGWCSGGAQSYFEAAIEQGVDVFISGEISEPIYHLARESGTAYIAAGHHATERFGVQALGEAVAARFGIEVEFVDLVNPV